MLATLNAVDFDESLRLLAASVARPDSMNEIAAGKQRYMMELSDEQQLNPRADI